MIKVFEAFAGVGSQRMALKNIGVKHEVVGISEIDKHALQSYLSIHGDCPNYGDISKIDPKDLPDMDLFTYSFPCQDLSVAGNQLGLKNGTRSGLLYECEKIIEEKRPKFLLLENVKNLIGKKFKNDFNKWLDYLEDLGYKNYWNVLNAKNYGVPQNRERVFVVSILGGGDFDFPKPIDNTLKLRDILEKDVDAKYYLKEEIQNRFKLLKEDNGYNSVIGTTKPDYRTIGQRDNVYSINNVMGSLVATDYKQPKQILTYKKYKINLPCICRQVGRNPLNPSSRKAGEKTIQLLEPNIKGVSNTLTTVLKDNYVVEKMYSVRKLTPLECWRLMGFKDEDFYKAEKVCSNTQLYKQAGNSIVVNVLEGIFRNMFLK